GGRIDLQRLAELGGGNALFSDRVQFLQIPIIQRQSFGGYLRDFLIFHRMPPCRRSLCSRDFLYQGFACLTRPPRRVRIPQSVTFFTNSSYNEIPVSDK